MNAYTRLNIGDLNHQENRIVDFIRKKSLIGDFLTIVINGFEGMEEFIHAFPTCLKYDFLGGYFEDEKFLVEWFNTNAPLIKGAMALTENFQEFNSKIDPLEKANFAVKTVLVLVHDHIVN